MQIEASIKSSCIPFDICYTDEVTERWRHVHRLQSNKFRRVDSCALSAG